MKSVYTKFIRPVHHRLKRLRNFLRDLCVCIGRGWDLRLLTSCDIKLYRLPRSTKFTHPVGIVISSKAVLGENCQIMQNVTIGRKKDGGPSPVIGDNVYIGCGAIILGDVKVGNNAVIGAGALVLEDVAADTVFVCGRTKTVLPLKQDICNT
jgi:serine O-acetyltransferase